jgi:hypothetical protein
MVDNVFVFKVIFEKMEYVTKIKILINALLMATGMEIDVFAIQDMKI